MLRRIRPFPDCPWFFAYPCAAVVVVLITLISIGSQALSLGTTGNHLAVNILFVCLLCLAAFLLYAEQCPTKTILLLLLPVAAALYLRLCLLDHQTHDYQTFLAQWVEFFRQNGGFSAIGLSVGDYNMPYLYFLAAISYSSIPDLYLIKIFSILFDLLLAWAAMRLCRRLCQDGSVAPLLCFTLFLFLPTFVLNGSFWGQCDSLYAALILLAADCALGDRPNVSVLLLAVAFSFKLQTVFLLPLWCVFWFIGRIKFRHLLLFPVGYAITILPALLLGKPLDEILSVYLTQAVEYNSRLTLNAPSIFSLFPYGVEVDVSLFSRIAIIAAFVFLFALLLILLLNRKRLTSRTILAAGAVMAIGIPFLLPHMHERYFFLAGVVTLLLACTDIRFIPVAVLTELSSLCSYTTYLRLKYTLPFQLGSHYFVMAFEGLLMLAALVWCIVLFFRQLSRPSPRNP